jgi:hypothetical protein
MVLKAGAVSTASAIAEDYVITGDGYTKLAGVKRRRQSRHPLPRGVVIDTT